MAKQKDIKKVLSKLEKSILNEYHLTPDEIDQQERTEAVADKIKDAFQKNGISLTQVNRLMRGIESFRISDMIKTVYSMQKALKDLRF